MGSPGTTTSSRASTTRAGLTSPIKNTSGGTLSHTHPYSLQTPSLTTVSPALKHLNLRNFPSLAWSTASRPRPCVNSSPASTKRSSSRPPKLTRKSSVTYIPYIWRFPLENGDEELVVTAKNFTELDRLSIVVHTIEDNCQIVPLGALKLTPTTEIINNPSFRGLKIDDSTNPNNYVHARKPTIPENVLLIQSGQALHRNDFLDAISHDPIKGSWSIQADESRTQVTVRSLLWPGYVGYHRTNSNVYGGVYFGDGIKNSDLPFLIN